MSVLWSVLAVIGMVLLFLLKGVGILLLGVLVLGLLLMFCPFCADVQWAEGIFQVKAGALGITFPVFRYPAPEKPEKKKKEKKVLSVEEKRKLAIKKCIGLIVALAVVSVLIATIEVAVIPTGSMTPTISPPSIVTGIRTNGHEINRFDVVCIKMSDSQALQTSVNPELPLCKRVIALGGEKVEIKDGKIFINDSPTPLDEPYLPADYVPNGNFGPFYVPEGQLFLMGDNRDNSYDSRYLDDHFFNQKDVTSVVFLVADKTGIDKI